MLEFIVLGIVPGTELQLSFEHYATTALIVVAIYGSIRIKQLRQQRAQESSDD